MNILGLMHACLEVDEILRSIAGELIAAERWRTAVSLACCCSIFEDPVLDVMWSRQTQLTTLLGILPRDIWSPGGWDSLKVSTTAAALVLSSPDPSVVTVLRQAHHDARVGTFVEVRAKNEGVNTAGTAAAADPLGPVVPYLWKPSASKPENSPVVVRPNHWRFHLFHPLVLFPKDNHHQTQICQTQPLQSAGRLDDHQNPNGMPRFAEH